MGGHAFRSQGLETQRLSVQDFETFKVATVQKLRDIITSQPHVVQSYSEKSDFGDIDILIPTSERSSENDVKIRVLLDATNEVKNGPVCSYRVPVGAGKHFQVDLIYVKDAEFEFATHYFAYNDLGNLIGRVAHAMGFKFGHNGLWYIYRDGDRVISEIEVTKDFQWALEFLGFDTERYEQGFSTLEDIYRFVSDSAFFNADIFLLHNRNAHSRVRDAKRKTYMSFLQWLENNKTKRFEYPENKKEWFTRAFAYFPKLSDDLLQADLKLQRSIEVNQKFNGQIVHELTGLTGKDLGSFIASLKARFDSNEEFQEYVLNYHDLSVWIQVCYKHWRDQDART